MTHIRLQARILALGLLASIACERAPTEPPPPPPPPPVDGTGPNFTIVLPTPDSHDVDGDGLVDFHLVWDGAEGIGQKDIRVRSLRGVNGTASAEANLLPEWRISAQSDSSISFHETLAQLMHDGENRVEISVSDSAGNVSMDTVFFNLRPSELIDTISSGRTSSYFRGIDLVICENRGYVTAGLNLLIFDIDSLTLIGDIRNPYKSDQMSNIACVPGDPNLYVTETIHRFNRVTQTWLGNVIPAYSANAIVPSRENSSWLYVGERGGALAVFDRVTQTRIRNLGVSPSFDRDDYTFALAVLPGDEKIYATRAYEGGIVVVDPRNGTILNRIKVSGNWNHPGVVDDMVLNSSSTRLYAAIMDGEVRGVGEIDTSTDSVVRVIPIVGSAPAMLALSPSGKRIFVTTFDLYPPDPSWNVLIDLQLGRAIQEFKRNRPAGASRFDAGVAFHPSGKLIFVARDLSVDVYLHRE